MSAAATARPRAKVLRFATLKPRAERSYTKVPDALFTHLLRILNGTEAAVLLIIHNYSTGRTGGNPTPVEISCAQIAKLIVSPDDPQAHIHRNTVVDAVSFLEGLGAISKQRDGRTNRYVSQPDKWAKLTCTRTSYGPSEPSAPPKTGCKAASRPATEPEPEIAPVVIAAGKSAAVPLREAVTELTIVNDIDLELTVESEGNGTVRLRGEKKANIRNSPIANKGVTSATCTVECADQNGKNGHDRDRARVALNDLLTERLRRQIDDETLAAVMVAKGDAPLDLLLKSCSSHRLLRSKDATWGGVLLVAKDVGDAYTEDQAARAAISSEAQRRPQTVAAPHPEPEPEPVPAACPKCDGTGWAGDGFCTCADGKRRKAAFR